MKTYSDILHIFEQLRIRSFDDLEKVLGQVPERGHDRIIGLDLRRQEGRALCQDLCKGLMSIGKELDLCYKEPGIHQFSLDVRSELKEEAIKKALFISKTATIFSNHNFSFKERMRVRFATEEPPIDEFYWDWALSHDFIRQMYRYQEAIKSGGLIVLPQAITYDENYDFQDLQQHVDLLKKLEESNRVVSGEADTGLIDAYLKMYKKNHQLIRLPDLHIPWIEGINIGYIVKFKNDYGEHLEDFQRIYNDALTEYIARYQCLDFEKLSKNIHHDIIEPQVSKIRGEFKRIIARHRAFSMVGASVAAITISSFIVSGALLGKMAPIIALGSVPTVATYVGHLALKRLRKEQDKDKLADEPCYVVWRLEHDKGR